MIELGQMNNRPAAWGKPDWDLPERHNFGEYDLIEVNGSPLVETISRFGATTLPSVRSIVTWLTSKPAIAAATAFVTLLGGIKPPSLFEPPVKPTQQVIEPATATSNIYQNKDLASVGALLQTAIEQGDMNEAGILFDRYVDLREPIIFRTDKSFEPIENYLVAVCDLHSTEENQVHFERVSRAILKTKTQEDLIKSHYIVEPKLDWLYTAVLEKQLPYTKRYSWLINRLLTENQPGKALHYAEQAAERGIANAPSDLETAAIAMFYDQPSEENLNKALNVIDQNSAIFSPHEIAKKKFSLYTAAGKANEARLAIQPFTGESANNMRDYANQTLIAARAENGGAIDKSLANEGLKAMRMVVESEDFHKDAMVWEEYDAARSWAVKTEQQGCKDTFEEFLSSIQQDQATCIDR